MKPASQKPSLYDGSVWKVMVLAAAMIVLSTSLIGVLSYRITEQEVIKKLKTSDLSLMAQAVGSQVEGRIARAVETSELLADDPTVLAWLRDGEKDERLGDIVRRKLIALPAAYDYTNSFVVSAETRHYWSESGQVLYTVDDKNPDDTWFFETLRSGRKTSVVVDSNPNRADTFVFVNVLIGDSDKPLGIAGIGLSLKKLSDEFAAYNFLQGSDLWMVGQDGTIHLADDYALIGTKIADHLTEEALTNWYASGTQEERVFEAKDLAGRRFDMISYPLRAAGMRLLVQIPRDETVGFLRSIQINTSVVVVLSLIVTVFFFTYISRRLADPYKRALELNTKLEQRVEERTRELAEQNRIMTESITYANRIQRSVLPSRSVLAQQFAECLTYWRPRDVVGGDFIWVKRTDGAVWAAVGDCTGHGVPGALMTMLSVSLLDRIVEQSADGAPADVLRELHVRLQATLNQQEREGPTDDGLDLGLFRIGAGEAVYAGTGILLLRKDAEGFRMIKGDKHRIGYRRTPADVRYTDHVMAADGDAVYYLVTDGVSDQNGGPRRISLGKTRLAEWLAAYGDMPLAEQQRRFEHDMSAFMGQEVQRDDMTMFAFRMKAGRYGEGETPDG